MKLPGIVTNITNFGAFVDIGVHQDGLVHTSQLANRFVANPNDVVKVSQQVEVTVTEVDVARKRISLSMRTASAGTKPAGNRNAGSRPEASAPASAKKPVSAKANQNRPTSKASVSRAKQADGDLQTKLEALKNLFKK
jgi:uncharacterized protein